MKDMLVRIIFLGICCCLVTPSLGDWSGKSLQEKKQLAIKNLRARKKGFDDYQKMKAEWENNRLSVAFKQKKIRKDYVLKKEKARKNFRRIATEFPINDYRKFIQLRNKKNRELEKARKDFSKMRKQLRKVYENKDFKIDGKKEYKL